MNFAMKFHQTYNTKKLQIICPALLLLVAIHGAVRRVLAQNHRRTHLDDHTTDVGSESLPIIAPTFHHRPLTIPPLKWCTYGSAIGLDQLPKVVREPPDTIQVSIPPFPRVAAKVVVLLSPTPPTTSL